MRTAKMKAVVAALGVLVATHASAAETTAPCDRELGAKVFELCSTCHSLKPGDAAREGPNLRGVLGRAAASSDAQYRYSPVLQASGWTWDEATLDRFLANPRRALPGTTMTFIGLKLANERQAVICHLRGAR